MAAAVHTERNAEGWGRCGVPGPRERGTMRGLGTMRAAESGGAADRRAWNVGTIPFVD